MVIWKQEIPWLFEVEKNVSIRIKTEDGQIIFLKVLANRFWLNIEANQRCQRTTKLFIADLLPNGLHDKVVIFTKKRLDLQFVKKIALVMVISQQMKEQDHNQNY